MLRLLIAVDGSAYADRAVGYALGRAAASRDPLKLHLLNVQTRLSGVHVKRFISEASQHEHYREEAMVVLEPARARVLAAGLACAHHIGVGDPGSTIVEYVSSLGCDEVVMGTHGRGFLGGVVMGSVAQKVINLAPVPVVVVK